MKKIIIWVLLALCLVGLIAGASVVYNNYMEENGAGGVAGVGGLFEQGERPEESSLSESKNDANEIETETEINSEDASETDSGAQVETESESNAKAETEGEVGSESETEEEAYYPAPDFTVYTADGEAVKLSDFAGKSVVINFWALDCPYCINEMPEFQKAYEKYGDEVVFMMVCHLGFANSTVSREQAFIDSSGYTFPVYYDVDGEAVADYWIRGIPNTYFVKSDGGLYEYYIPGATDYTTLEECILGAMGK